MLGLEGTTFTGAVDDMAGELRVRITERIENEGLREGEEQLMEGLYEIAS
jgi:predicted translin family RNA/ssDNA-binding protein